MSVAKNIVVYICIETIKYGRFHLCNLPYVGLVDWSLPICISWI